jgi:hypothetical protein
MRGLLFRLHLHCLSLPPLSLFHTQPTRVSLTPHNHSFPSTWGLEQRPLLPCCKSPHFCVVLQFLLFFPPFPLSSFSLFPSPLSPHVTTPVVRLTTPTSLFSHVAAVCVSGQRDARDGSGGAADARD